MEYASMTRKTLSTLDTIVTLAQSLALTLVLWTIPLVLLYLA